MAELYQRKVHFTLDSFPDYHKKMKMLVPQVDLPPRPHRPLFLNLIANFTITSMLFFIILVDLIAWVYQFIYFGISGIPKIERKKYIQVTRYKLPGLTLFQKWSCGYCEYVNGLIAYVKAIANQTEIFSCAIKYSNKLLGQEYQSQFYEQSEFQKKL